MKINLKVAECECVGHWVLVSKNRGIVLCISKRSKYLNGLNVKEGDEFTIDLKKVKNHR